MSGKISQSAFIHNFLFEFKRKIIEFIEKRLKN